MSSAGQSRTALEWKEAGNSNFGANEFTEAARCYTNGITVLTRIDTSTRIALLANRAATYLNIDRAEAAFADCVAVLRLDSGHVKAMYRFEKACSALGRPFAVEYQLLALGGGRISFEDVAAAMLKRESVSTEGLKNMLSAFSFMRMRASSQKQSELSWYRHDLVDTLPKLHEQIRVAGSKARRLCCAPGADIECLCAAAKEGFYTAASSDIHRMGVSNEKHDEPQVLMKRYQHNMVNHRDLSFSKPRRFVDEVENVLYGTDILHSYANCSEQARNLTLAPNTKHLFIGFGDFGALLNANWLAADSAVVDDQKRATVIAVDSSSFVVAKHSIVLAMMHDTCTPPEAVVEVWYSSTWTKSTFIAFKRAAQHVAAKLSGTGDSSSSDSPPPLTLHCFSKEAIALVTHWAATFACPLTFGRNRFIEARRGSCSPAFQLRNVDSVCEVLRHLHTGDLITNSFTCEDDLCASTTMFDLPLNLKGNLAHDQEVFSTLTGDALMKLCADATPTNRLMDRIAALKVAQVASLSDMLRRGVLEIEVREQTIDKQTCFASLGLAPDTGSFTTVNWSNVVDYLSRATLHALSLRLGPTAHHHGYSMNWGCSIKGTCIIDFPTKKIETLLETLNERVARHYRSTGAHKSFHCPPLDTPLNFGMVGKLDERSSSFVQHLLAPGDTLPTVKVSDVHLCEYTPLHRANSTLFFSWTYNVK